jgi:glutamyl-tRNA synthetase
MGITHVMRGQDHVSNTPKQIAVYRALGAATPVFVHVPMINGPDGKKLSKRHGATAVGDYRHMGILPGAMRNFLALLGWNPGDDRELYFDPRELIQAFSIERIQKTSAVFDVTKLEWMNGQYLNHLPVDQVLPLIAESLEALDVDPAAFPRDRVYRCIAAIRSRCRTTLELAKRVAVRLDGRHVVKDDPKARKLIERDPQAFRAALEAVRERLAPLPEPAWTSERLEAELRELAERMGVGVGAVMQPPRVALTGETVSEPVNELLAAVGREESLARLAAAQTWVAVA